jgi:hypothetical protein
MSLRRIFSVSLLVVLVLSGCGRFRPKPPREYVYVVAKETFLRDRIAAVSNRVANVTNGQRLEVLERSRRFLKVKTDKGEIGWIEEHGVIDQDTFQQFLNLQKQHQNDPVIATATLRDDLYLHLKPGRQEARFYLLPENDKLQMLVRASVPKPVPPQALPLPVAKANGKADQSRKDKQAASAPEAPPMEDWWLVRDAQGRVGWTLSRRLDIDVPDAIAGYAEGQRMVGAYPLTTVYDPEAANFPEGKVPEYVTVLGPYKDGLPYDFDQVRVFTWNTKKHRYETAFRQRNIQGYLPVRVGTQSFDKIGRVPVFFFRVASDDSIAIDPSTGASHPAHTEELGYRLEGVIVRKIEPAAPQGALPAPQQTSTPAPAKEHKMGRRHPAHTGARRKHH